VSTTKFQPSATLTASELHSELLNTQLDEESIFCAVASGENLSETFDDSLDSKYVGGVVLNQLGQPIINFINPGNPLPSFYLAGTDETLFLNTTEPYTSPTPDTGMHISLMNQHLGISAGRQASNRRRRRAAEHRCDICGHDFTAAHNLRCCTF